MSDYLPKHTPGNAVTFTASAPVIGGRLVEVTGDKTVGPAAADSAKVVGVAGFDADAGEHVTVYSGNLQKLVAAGAIAAGAKVTAAAAGKAQTAGSGVNPIGLALQAATATDDVIDVLFK